ncbi:MAG: TRAP transporter small permease subunit, partial [Geminicoccaceae bacterium]
MSNQARQPSIDPVEAFEQVIEHRDADRQPIAGALERFVTTVGHMVMWANVALITAIIAQVGLRYLFDVNYPKLDEIQWHFYGLTTMVGLSYAMIKDSHVRVDILHLSLKDSAKRVIEIIGILALLVPFIYLIVDQGYDYFAESYRVNERSDSPIGLPARWAFKAIIPISFLLLATAALARLIHDVHALFTAPAAKEGRGLGTVLAVLAGFALVAVLLASLVETTEEKLVVAMFLTFIGLLFTGFPVAWVLAGTGVL